MSLRGILKMFAAFFMSQGVNVVNQLLVPPLFLHRYPHGVEMYGEWVALTAAVTYLATLNAGIQNYANNEMTLLYNRGEQEAAKTVQASALRLILIMVLIATVLGVSILFLPVANWMGLRHVSSAVAAMTLFLMALQLVATWFFAFLSNSYQVIGELHRGTNWQNAQRLTAVLTMAVFLWIGASFPVLALTQLASMVLYALILLAELRIRATILIPSLRYGNRRDMLAVLKPSAYYGVYAFSAFFCWQGPVLLIEKLLGPAAVALFALSRVVFNMSRQLLIILTYSIGQETIRLIALRSWAQLRRIYDLSERIVLALVPVLIVGVLLACPAIFSVWLRHDRTLYKPGLCALMAAVSAIMGVREHKYAFQNLSNRHEGVARFSLVAYVLMIVTAAFSLRAWGVNAFMVCWLAAELAIAVYVIAQNQKLFPAEFRPSLAPLRRAGIVLVLAFAAAAWPVKHDAGWSLTKLSVVAAAAGGILFLVDFFVFRLKDVQDVFWSRIRRRLSPALE
jgi:O-antigen/teichoic acid export membrane protein